jgi:predicted Zn-dependent protease
MYKLAPRSWHVHRLQAELYAEQDRHREAIAEYLEAIRAETGNADLYEKLGEEYRKTSQLDLAHDAYEKELKLSPGNGVAMYNLGSIDIERDDAKEGVPLLQEVVRVYAKAPVITYYLGRGLAELGRNQEAVKYLEDTIKADPSSEVAKRSYFELHSIYRRMQKPVEAQRAISEYLKLKQQMDNASAKQLEDWKLLNGISAQPSSAAEPGVQPPSDKTSPN